MCGVSKKTNTVVCPLIKAVSRLAYYSSIYVIIRNSSS